MHTAVSHYCELRGPALCRRINEFNNIVSKLYYNVNKIIRPGQVDSQFIVRDFLKSHAGGRPFFIFHSTADCSIEVK